MRVKDFFYKLPGIFFTLGSSLLFFSSIAHADIAVIVNPANQGASVTMTNVQEIFLGIRGRLSNGAEVTPVDQGQDQKIRQNFYKLVASKNAVEMKAYWTRLIFTGRGSPPPVLPSAQAVRERVASDKRAIGYIEAGTVKGASDVSTIFVIPE